MSNKKRKQEKKIIYEALRVFSQMAPLRHALPRLALQDHANPAFPFDIQRDNDLGTPETVSEFRNTYDRLIIDRAYLEYHLSSGRSPTHSVSASIMGHFCLCSW
jgi:hypothetical protein